MLRMGDGERRDPPSSSPSTACRVVSHPPSPEFLDNARISRPFYGHRLSLASGVHLLAPRPGVPKLTEG